MADLHYMEMGWSGSGWMDPLPVEPRPRRWPPCPPRRPTEAEPAPGRPAPPGGTQGGQEGGQEGRPRRAPRRRPRRQAPGRPPRRRGQEERPRRPGRRPPSGRPRRAPGEAPRRAPSGPPETAPAPLSRRARVPSGQLADAGRPAFVYPFGRAGRTRRAVDQRDVGEGLGKVAQELARWPARSPRSRAQRGWRAAASGGRRARPAPARRSSPAPAPARRCRSRTPLLALQTVRVSGSDTPARRRRW